MATIGVSGSVGALPTETSDIISYYPTTGDALRFWSLREDRNVLADVPQGFPAHVDGPMVWRGSDMEQQPGSWIVQLSEADVVALETAMHEFQSRLMTTSSLVVKGYTKYQRPSLACVPDRSHHLSIARPAC